MPSLRVVGSSAAAVLAVDQGEPEERGIDAAISGAWPLTLVAGVRGLAVELGEVEDLEFLDGLRAAPAPWAQSVARPVAPPASPAPRRATPRPSVRTPATAALYARAGALWPRLDTRAVSRTGGDPRRLARLIARRTVLSEESILHLLLPDD